MVFPVILLASEWQQKTTVIVSVYRHTSDCKSRMNMHEPKSSDIDRLAKAALKVRDHAYAPHSHFYVGAALLMDDGKIYSGCNVENASFSLTICAERVAASAAVAAGYRSWRAIAIASDGGAMPCGACRQFLAEFGIDLKIVVVDVIEGTKEIRRLSQLLPDSFAANNLPETQR